ncbi:MAG: class I SAM-dependent methyltransferase [Saprospiraceae bacterium]
MTKIEFFREGIKNIKTVGTISRSSKFLCKGAIKHVNFENAKTIVELGAGDGVITKHILDSMRPDAKLIAFEVNGKFCDLMRERFDGDQRLHVAEDSAEKIGEYLKSIGETKADYIVSAIPFVALPKEVGRKIVGEAHKHLKKGGLYIQIHYSLLAKSLYEDTFGNVDVNFVPINVPPAFVMVSEKL